LLKEDAIWFIIDTDQWGEKVGRLHKECDGKPNWFVAQSYPCFEVWLYYHFFNRTDMLAGIEIASNWKSQLNDKVQGGFDSKKHPLRIETAILHAQHAFETDGIQPMPGCTAVYKPAGCIHQLLNKKIAKMLDGSIRPSL
jgi:hypothetical protein